MKRATFLAVAVVGLFCVNVHAQIVAQLISGPAERVPSSGGDIEFNRGVVRMALDPAVTKWVAWNGDAPFLIEEDPRSPGEKLLGTHGRGIDDYIRLTVTNPLRQSATRDMDRNDIRTEPIGPQAMIFSTVPDLPRVTRGSALLSETGAFNDLFTTAGDYTFDFSFRDTFGASASHGDVYLLASVPEPSTVLLIGGAVVGLAIFRFIRRLRRSS